MADVMTFERRAPGTVRPRLVVADDDAFVRSLLTAQLDYGFECVGAAADADEAVALVAAHRPDVALLDVNMPCGGAIQATRAIRVVSPETAIVILSSDDLDSEVIDLLGAGAIAYLRKGIDPLALADRLIGAIDVHRHAAARHAGAAADIDVPTSTDNPLDNETEAPSRGTGRETADRKQIEHVAEHFAAIVEAFGDAIIGENLDGVVTSWNSGAEHLYGYTKDEMQGRSISVLVPPGVVDDLAEILDRVRDGERIDEYETVRVRKDGTQVAVSLTVSSMCRGDGTVVGASTIARDITGRVEYRKQLVHLAEHDALTGIRNRRGFERDLSDQLERAHRYGEPSVLLMIDINGFKRINDSHGHKTGDRVLKAVGAALTTRLRRTDIVARLGGDEFVVLLPYAGAGQADTTSEALRQVISAASVRLENGTTLSVSASIGFALIGPDTASGDAALAGADRSMYEDKARQTRRR